MTRPSDRTPAVASLLRALVLVTLEAGMLRERVPKQARLVGVLLDQIRATDEAPLQLLWPIDPRSRRAAEFVRADVGATKSLGELVTGSGASVHTLERLFARDTRTTFSR